MGTGESVAGPSPIAGRDPRGTVGGLLAEQDVDRSGVRTVVVVADGLVGDPDGEVRSAVAVEVAARQGPSEAVVMLHDPGDVGGVLVPQLVVGRGQPAAGSMVLTVTAAFLLVALPAMSTGISLWRTAMVARVGYEELATYSATMAIAGTASAFLAPLPYLVALIVFAVRIRIPPMTGAAPPSRPPPMTGGAAPLDPRDETGRGCGVYGDRSG